MKIALSLIVISILQFNIWTTQQNSVFAQAKATGGIKGRVVDEKGQPLLGANIMVVGTSIGASTNFEGYYKIKKLLPGNYKVKVSFVGYKNSVKKVRVVAGKIMLLNFKLFPESFKIGGIVVTAKEDLLPTDVESKTEINSSEIEHYQATSLKDVLDLVPGVQKSANPGLNKTSQIAIRGDETDRLSAFGTKIIIDGEPMSNNANLQFESLTGSKFGASSMGGSVDLRLIPADNLQSVSVITGMPSVRYGDFTNGIIELRTKMGARPNRLKVKNNPSTSEANFGGGIALGKNSLSYNLNVARSQRDLRITGDEYTRYTGQLVYSTLLFNKKWRANYKIRGRAVYDEEEPRNDLSLTNNYNRGFNIGFNTWGEVKPFNDISKFNYNFYVNMDRVNSRKSHLVSDYLITPQGDTLASFIGAVETKGIQWTAGGRLEWQNVFFTGNYIHKFLAGSEWEYDVNTGQGVMFDTLYNYYGVDSKKRPYSFDSIPGQLLWSLYAEDRITGHLGVDFSLMFGFRYEMYRPYAFNLSGLWGDGDLVKSYQGSFFNPRISLQLYLSKTNQLRINLGRTSKSPPMSTVYPPEQIFSWRNPIDSTVTYFRINRHVPDLKGYQATQAEISFDQKLFNKLGVTVTAFYRERKNQPMGEPHHIFKEIDNNGKKEIYYIDTYYLSRNMGEHFSKGVEFSIRTAKIKPLNMNFKVTGSYFYSKSPSIGYHYSLYPDTSLGQKPNYHVPNVSVDTVMGWTYPSSGRWEDRFQINYYVKYTNRALGMWVTLRAEQLLYTRYQNFSLKPVDYSKLTPTALAVRRYQEAVFKKPVKWLFNLNVSKSLFKGAEVSFYVNNFLDDPAIWRFYSVSLGRDVEAKRNPELFYGIEFSMILDYLFR